MRCSWADLYHVPWNHVISFTQHPYPADLTIEFPPLPHTSPSVEEEDPGSDSVGLRQILLQWLPWRSEYFQTLSPVSGNVKDIKSRPQTEVGYCCCSTYFFLFPCHGAAFIHTDWHDYVHLPPPNDLGRQLLLYACKLASTIVVVVTCFLLHHLKFLSLLFSSGFRHTHCVCVSTSSQVLIDLSNTAQLDNTPRWLPLREQSESIEHSRAHHAAQGPPGSGSGHGHGQGHSQGYMSVPGMGQGHGHGLGQAHGQGDDSPKNSVIKSRSHGIFPDPAKGKGHTVFWTLFTHSCSNFMIQGCIWCTFNMT